MSPSEPQGSLGRPAYARTTGSPRGETRRRQLLDRVTDDLEKNGLVGFSLRRAAGAAGTTHKVLLYYFDGPDDLMGEAIMELRRRRIGHLLSAAEAPMASQTLADRVSAVWQALTNRNGALRVLDQASGLAMYDPDRYAALGREATEQYLPSVVALCPSAWPSERKSATAALILATLRGLLLDYQTGGNERRVSAGLHALLIALDREEEQG